MKMMSLFIAAALSLSGTIAVAQARSTIVDSECRVDVNDVNDIGFRLTTASNLYAGKCINGDKFRPIRSYQVRNDQNRSAIFDNYLKEHQFWQAEVPLDIGAVDKVYFQIQRFVVVEGVSAAHTQLRFSFKDSQAIKLQNSKGTSTENDLLVSFEAALPKGVSYNFALGAFSNYALVARILSTKQKYFDNPANSIEQYELNLSDLEKAQLLEMSLQYAQSLGMNSFYNTLKPNCTTQVFDLIDSLPRFKGKFPAFLTVLSPDPIAGPSVEGLVARKLISARAQNFDEELQGTIATYPLPKQTQALSSFLPSVDGQPWSLVTVLPDLTFYREEDKKIISEIRDGMVASIPTLIQNYGAAMMLRKSEGDQSLFLMALKDFVSKIPAMLRKMNGRLPERSIKIAIYFAPYEAARSSTSIIDLGVPAQIPFSVNDQQLSDYDRATYKVFSDVFKGVQSAGAAGLSSNPKAYLTGAAILVHAQKDHSHVNTQLLAGLNPIESEMVTETAQVRIEKINIPSQSKSVTKPSVLITHHQEVREEKVNEVVKIEFGPLSGLGGEWARNGYGSYEVAKPGLFCREQRESSPYFAGKLAPAVTGFGPLDGVLHGKDIRFYLSGLNLNLKTRKIEDMKLTVSVLGVNCVSLGEVNKQFTQSANKSLQDALNKVQENPLVKALSPFLN